MKERIKKIRKDYCMSQDAFGEKVFVTGNYITFIETGRRNPSKRLISDICREFEVNEEWLRFGTGEPYVSQRKILLSGIKQSSDDAARDKSKFFPDEKIGDRIQQVRKDNMLKQYAFAEKIGLCRQSVNMIELGKRKPSRCVIRNICREFNVNEEWLCSGTGNPCDLPSTDKIVARVEISSGDDAPSFSHVKDRIYWIRKKNGLTQPAFGEKLGLSKGAIWMIETGRREPCNRTISVICQEFDINKEWLCYGVGAPFASSLHRIMAEKSSTLQIIEGVVATYSEMDKESRDVIDSFCERLLQNLKK